MTDSDIPFNDFSTDDLIRIYNSEPQKVKDEEIEIIEKILTERGYTLKDADELEDDDEIYDPPTEPKKNDNTFLRLLSTAFLIGAIFLGSRSGNMEIFAIFIVAAIAIKLYLLSQN